MSIENLNDKDFANYLLMVAADYEESGSEATAEDYREAARRIQEIEYREETAFEGGMREAIATKIAKKAKR